MRSEARVVITNPTGLHARPAVKLARLAAAFDADIEVRAGESDQWVRARSTAHVMKLKARAQSTIHFRAEGDQAEDALSALVEFVRRDFDEGPPTGSPPAVDPSAGDSGVGDSGVGDSGGGDSGGAGTGSGVAANDAPGACPAPGDGESPGGFDAATDVEGAHRSRGVPGVVASPGLAIGVLYTPGESSGPSRTAGNPREERAALDEALAQALAELELLAGGTGELARDVIGFQVSLLRDVEFLEPVRLQVDAGVAADRAWERHLAEEIADCESAPTAYLRDRAADLRDLRGRVARAFEGDGSHDELPEQCIVVADELTPSRFLELDPSRAVAVATRAGSPASHVAMLARAHGVPMLVQLGCAPGDLQPGTEAIVDADADSGAGADRGYLVLAPRPTAREHYARRIDARRVREREAARQASRPVRTRDGTPVRVLLNVDDPARLSGVEPSFCDGIGLTRTEFLFHRAPGLPDAGLPGEETQLDCYRRLVAWADGRPVTVRTLDAGGDKPIPGLTMDGESNPFLGLRGVRLSLSRPEVFATQLRALARAAAGGEVKVMLPMVTKPAELEEARRLLGGEVKALREAGIEAAMPRLGMMIEVPAAALTVDAFDADFFSIGTNDLTQYVLAAGRDSSAVADLLDPLHPAVLELVERVASACARSGREVSVCGEMAAHAEGRRALFEAGIRVFSVPPAALASTKAALASL